MVQNQPGCRFGTASLLPPRSQLEGLHQNRGGFAPPKCGERPGPNVFDEAARVAMANAEPLPQNTFKVDLGKHAVKRALTLATTARQLRPGDSG